MVGWYRCGFDQGGLCKERVTVLCEIAFPAIKVQRYFSWHRATKPQIRGLTIELIQYEVREYA